MVKEECHLLGVQDYTQKLPANYHFQLHDGCQVCYVDGADDADRWRPVVKYLSDLLERQASPKLELDLRHEVVVRIKVLVPWDIAKVEVVRQPKANRFALDVPATHRFVVLWLADDSFKFQSDEMAAIKTCRERFTRYGEVRLGIWVHGTAPQ